MNPETKQRIVGFIVIIAFIAILIPFLFSSSAKKNQQKDHIIDNIPISLSADKKQSTEMQSPVISPDKQHPETGVAHNQLQNDIQAIALHKQSAGSLANKRLPEIDSEHDKTQDQSLDLQKTQEFAPIESEIIKEMQNAPENLKNTITTDSIAEPAPAIAPPNTDNLTNKKITKNRIAMANTNPKTIHASIINATKKSKTKFLKPFNKKKNITKNQKEFWSVQIGSFTDQTHIQNLITELHKHGFHVFMQKITTSNGVFTRILVGHETSKEKADQIARKLENTITIKGHLIRNHT